MSAFDYAAIDILEMIQHAATVSVIRATVTARDLAARSPDRHSEVGYDTVNLSIKVPPERADILLRFIGGRS